MINFIIILFLLILYSFIPSGGDQFSSGSVRNTRRKPLAPITNNRIDNNTSYETIGSYTNINNICNNGIDDSNDISEPHSGLHLNNTTSRSTPCPTLRSNNIPGLNNTPRFTPRSNNTPGINYTPRSTPRSNTPGINNTPRFTPQSNNTHGLNDTPRSTSRSNNAYGLNNTPRSNNTPGLNDIPRSTSRSNNAYGLNNTPRSNNTPGLNDTPRSTSRSNNAYGLNNTPQSNNTHGLNDTPRSTPRSNTPGINNTPRFTPQSNNTPGLNDTPRSNNTHGLNDTPRSNNTYMELNDDIFRSNSYRSNNAHGLNDTPRSNNTYMELNDDVFRSNSHLIPRSNARFYNNCQTSESNQLTLPAAFRDMNNVHQICLWLCENPSILLLAYNMHLSIQTPVANAFHFTSNFNSLMPATGIPQIPKQDDRVCIIIIYFFL